MKLSWPWPACSTPKSLSFRAPTNDTVESREFEEYIATDSPEEDAVEAVIRGLRRSTERLFYEPEETSLVVVEKEEEEEKNKKKSAAAAAEAVMTVEVESEDPCMDFKKSMVEMVEAYGLKEWDSLEELLSWYLQVNTKKNHGYVVRAFLDLLTFLDFTTTSSSSCSSSSSSCNTSSNSHHHRHHHHQCCCSSCSTTTTTSGGGGDSSYVTTTRTKTCCSSTSSTSPCLSCSLQAEDDDGDEEEIRIKTVLGEVDDD